MVTKNLLSHDGHIIVVAVVVVACNIAAEIAMPSKEEHYSCNENNTMPPTDDKVPEDWLVSGNKEDTTRQKGPAANAHQFTASDHKSNVKYVSPYKKMEAIYDANGNLVEDPQDIGTYNFGTSLIGHYVKDVKPWIRWGNSPDDTTTPWERMWGLLGIYG